MGALDATTDADGRAWTAAAKSAPVAEISSTGTLVNGAAIVSGTSFAAPDYAGYLAEEMSVSPTVTVRTVSTQLLDAGRTPLPTCGTNTAIPGKAVALGSFDGWITDPAVGNGTR